MHNVQVSHGEKYNDDYNRVSGVTKTQTPKTQTSDPENSDHENSDPENSDPENSDPLKSKLFSNPS